MSSSGEVFDRSVSQTVDRVLSQQNELGSKGDCPVSTRICWTWLGITQAASRCWDDEFLAKGADCIAGIFDKQPSEVTAENPLKSLAGEIELKCGVTFEGDNVYQGFQSIVSMGLARTPLPDFIRDSPAIGSNTITVCRGKIVLQQSYDRHAS